MTNATNVSLDLQAIFERLEVDTRFDDNTHQVLELTCVVWENGHFIPMYASNSIYHSFPTSQGRTYTFMTRKGAQAFLDTYHAWFHSYIEGIG
jgi:hypothetical protein